MPLFHIYSATPEKSRDTEAKLKDMLIAPRVERINLTYLVATARHPDVTSLVWCLEQWGYHQGAFLPKDQDPNWFQQGGPVMDRTPIPDA
jgi:hypothetical protein